MYAHDIQEYGDISRIFDVLLAREAVFSLYIFAQIMLERADELFEIPDDEPEMMHSVLSKLPKPLKLEKLIADAVTLFEKHPPEKLATWRAISSSSVLKTARYSDQSSAQTLQDGEVYFMKQVKELQRAEQLERAMKLVIKYKRPARAVVLAVTIAVFSVWLRRSAGPLGMFGAFTRFFHG